MNRFSLARAYAVFIKEFQQMLRDRMTFAMAILMPVIQMVLFGYAINTDPKDLPMVVVAAEQGPLQRSLVAALQNTDYFRVVASGVAESEGDAMLARGDAQFMLVFPPHFERDVRRGLRPVLYMAVDATDPMAAANAMASLEQVGRQTLAAELRGPGQAVAPVPSRLDLRVHKRYNPEGLSRLNIVPGLIGTILTMTMVMLTSMAMTRERERGTMENLLATPVRPLEVMVGKIVPYVVIGYVQLAVILAAAWGLFNVPLLGSFNLLMVMIGVFIVANLAVGFTFSTLARNQLQAMQMTFFFFLPSMLLSGFMFPFRGMPEWAQWLGEAMPLTHFLRIVRGIMLKGTGMAEAWPDLWPLLTFMAVVGVLALKRYRQTLD
ncbi:ABC transporter permease [Ottowia sp.]|uniref:ABC transporter permease n=1 Tax=Ottowia sp. TaxID=1898956 RepID=UPI003A842627